MVKSKELDFDWKLAFEKWLWVLIVGCFLLDQVTKEIIIQYLSYGSHIPVFKLGPLGFDIVHVQNRGAAFGIFHSSSPSFRLVFFGIVTAVCLYLIVYWLGTTERKERVQRLALSLILGGALGNLMDRIRFGYVTDFLDFYWVNSHWPAFNVADMAISVGVGLIILRILMSKKKRVGTAA